MRPRSTFTIAQCDLTFPGEINRLAENARGLLRRVVPLLQRVKLERPLRAFYEGVHVFRGHVRLMVWIFLLTLAVQAVRVLAIWMAGSRARMGGMSLRSTARSLAHSNVSRST